MIAGEIGFVWWQAGMLYCMCEWSLELGRSDDAERLGREGLELAHGINDRMHTVYLLALLARAAAHGGRAERAGVIWGAVEAEEQKGAVGQWEDERELYAAPVLAHAGPDFERGRHVGSRLSFDEAVEYALSEVGMDARE
jgi:hypothetical protein